MARRKKKTVTPHVPRAPQRQSRLLIVFMWLSTSGLLAVLFAATYQHFFGNVSLEFLQPQGRGYEFQFKNDTPSDRVIRQFRVEPPRPQNVIYKVTQDVYAERNERGEIILPGGNTSYVPAVEYKELDGQKVAANSSTKFRIPPLSSRTWMEPEATIVDIRYEIKPTNPALLVIEKLLSTAGFSSTEHVTRYLVVDNYWITSRSTSLDEAIRIACRDDDSIAKTSACQKGH